MIWLNRQGIRFDPKRSKLTAADSWVSLLRGRGIAPFHMPMSESIHCLCVGCRRKLDAPFPEVCPHCGFSIEHLAGKKLSDFQKQKKDKHSDLLLGREIQLHGSNYNASFDNYGDASLEDLMRFTMSYGHHARLPRKGGRPENEIVVAFIPDIIGSGVSIYDVTYAPVACSGVAIISPASETYGHGFPALDDWVRDNFKTENGSCVSCRTQTTFGHPLCHKCYESKGLDWRNFL
jgi:hypothetical protein